MPVDVPFGDPVPELPLPRAPLAKVVAQLRFPVVAAIGKQDFISPFQESLRKRYPILREEREVGLVLGPEGITAQSEKGSVWRLQDKSNAWRVSLAPSFLALETDSYTNRAEFFERFEQALVAMDALIGPAVFDRLGVRYVDRLQGQDLVDLPQLIRAEVLGMMVVSVGPGRPPLAHSVSESVYVLNGQSLLARTAFLPPGASFDPTVQPVDAQSWVLDLDLFTNQPHDFNAADVASRARTFSDVIYRFFRWAVTDDFLRRFGGAT